MKRRDIIPPVLFAVAVLLLWELSCRYFNVKEYLLPAPSKIATVLCAEFSSLLHHSMLTLIEALIGFAVANVGAIALGMVILFIPTSEKAVMPFAVALKTTPIVAMAPLLLIWLGTGMAPKVAAAALISFFPALVNSIKGFGAVQEGEVDLFRVYGAKRHQILFKLRFHRAAPYIFSAFKVSSSLAIVGAIVGEFVGANEGIGYVILVSSYHLDSPKMFAALVVAAAAGTMLYGIIAFLDRKMVFWLNPPSDEARLESPSPRKVTKRPKNP